jgi:hypothetical protein
MALGMVASVAMLAPVMCKEPDEDRDGLPVSGILTGRSIRAQRKIFAKITAQRIERERSRRGMGAWGKIMWEHMRKLRQWDVRIKGIMQVTMAVGEVVVIDVEGPATGLDIWLNDA